MPHVQSGLAALIALAGVIAFALPQGLKVRRRKNDQPRVPTDATDYLVAAVTMVVSVIRIKTRPTAVSGAYPRSAVQLNGRELVRDAGNRLQ